MQTEQILAAETLRAALGPVVRKNAGRWLRFILAVLRNDSDAEDVIQEAVRRVLARNLSFESADHLRMYLGRAIGNVALELYNCRKKERLRQIPIHEEIFLQHKLNPFASAEESEQRIDREQLLGLLDEGLRRLPLKQYEALRLTILDSRGLSIREVGSHHGIAYSTLRHRSQQGLKRLRKFLEKKVRIRKH